MATPPYAMVCGAACDRAAIVPADWTCARIDHAGYRNTVCLEVGGAGADHLAAVGDALSSCATGGLAGLRNCPDGGRLVIFRVDCRLDLMVEQVPAFLRFAPLFGRWADEDDACPGRVAQVDGGRGIALEVSCNGISLFAQNGGLHGIAHCWKLLCGASTKGRQLARDDYLGLLRECGELCAALGNYAADHNMNQTGRTISEIEFGRAVRKILGQ